MNTMTYKGYTARVEHDERDNIFAGRILGIRNIISFHGETVAELRAEFELAIKNYTLRIARNRKYILKSLLPASCCCVSRPRSTAVHLLPHRPQAKA